MAGESEIGPRQKNRVAVDERSRASRKPQQRLIEFQPLSDQELIRLRRR